MLVERLSQAVGGITGGGKMKVIAVFILMT
jgi:hypothetical protein